MHIGSKETMHIGTGEKDMAPKLLGTLLVMTANVSLANAEEFLAYITKVDGNNVTFIRRVTVKEREKPTTDQKQQVVTIRDLVEREGKITTRPVAKDIKVNKGYY